MGRRTTSAAAEAAAVQSTDAAAQAAVQTTETAAPTEIPEAYANYQELPAVVAAPLGLNLRKGPAVSFGALEILSDGAPVTVLPLPYGAEVKGWALIVPESGTCGWVMTEFLTEPTAGE